MSSLGAPIVGIPGVRAVKTATARNVWGGYPLPLYKPQGALISGTYSRDPLNTGNLTVLRAGLLMGKRTSGGLYAPSVMGLLVSGGTVGSVALTVSAATAVELARRVGTSGTFKMAGPPTAAGITATETVTYSAVDTTTGVITCTATVNAYIATSLIQPTDGSETMLSFIDVPYGVPIADLDSTVQTQCQWPAVPVGGMVAEAGLINWPADASLRAWIIARLNGLDGSSFIFDGRY